MVSNVPVAASPIMRSSNDTFSKHLRRTRCSLSVRMYQHVQYFRGRYVYNVAKFDIYMLFFKRHFCFRQRERLHCIDMHCLEKSWIADVFLLTTSHVRSTCTFSPLQFFSLLQNRRGILAEIPNFCYSSSMYVFFIIHKFQ